MEKPPKKKPRRTKKPPVRTTRLLRLSPALDARIVRAAKAANEHANDFLLRIIEDALSPKE